MVRFISTKDRNVPILGADMPVVLRRQIYLFMIATVKELFAKVITK